ncbi:MAG: hypothetical protein JRI68_06055 [Deltaproteobacteria bacterium]|nr:hypothetical protein [Deltaproteobacteria bacterium]
MITVRYLALVGALSAGSVLVMPACDDGEDTSAGGSTSTSNGTGGSSSGTTTTTTTSGQGGQPLLTCTETVTNVPAGDCDPLNPLVTCETGFYCDVTQSGVLCASSQGKGVFGAGQPCSGESECAPGLACQMGKCSPVCCRPTNEPCNANSGECNIEVNLGNDNWVRRCSYLPACTLLENTCDPNSGYDCHIQNPSACSAVCAPPSSAPAPEGGSCSHLNDCGESQICNDNGGDAGNCRQLCNVNSWQTDEVPLGGCDPDRTCEPLSTACAEWDHLGICMPSGGTGGAGGA